MNTKDHSTAKTDRVDDKFAEMDFSILRSSEKQQEGIKYASEKLEKALKVDKKKFSKIFEEIYTEMQIRESRYHFQMETDLPQAKLAMKKMLEPQLKEKVLKLIPNEKNYNNLELVIENLFRWYISEYLNNN